MVRERGHFWNSKPGRWLLLSSAADIAVVTLLAVRGILMPAIRPRLVFALLALCVAYLSIIDFAKIGLLKKLLKKSEAKAATTASS